MLSKVGYGVSFIILLSNWMWISKLEHFVAVTTFPATIIIVPHLVWRLCLFGEEFFLMNSRYSVTQLLTRALKFNFISGFICILTASLLLAFHDKLRPVESVLELGLIPYCLSIFSFVILFSVTQLHQCPAWEAHAMRHMNPLDYGSGMAHSYYHGYLRLILPTRGDKIKSLRERIEDFMEGESIKECDFPVKRLIILVPSSGFTFPKLSDDPTLSENERDIEPVESLQDHLRDRAGTQQRVYRGGAYRIRVRLGKETSFLYVVAEGATPMLTFREAYTAGSPEAEHLREHKVDIVSNFHRTLNKLIQEDPECRNLVELLYYNDEDSKSPTDIVCLLREFLLQRRNSM